MMRNSWFLGGVVIAVLIGVGCGDAEPDARVPPVTTPVAATDPPPGPSTSPPPKSATAPEIVEVFRDFEYYGACGNETVLVAGTRFYPVPVEPSKHVVPGLATAIDESRYPDPPTVDGFARVGPPGPGDDVGTMVVYSDGMARFESDSGWIIWLTDREQIYAWEC